MIIPSVKLSGKITIPSSKSQTIRALLISVFSRGVSYIKHPLISDDTESCINAVKAMGADVAIDDNGDIKVDATYAFCDMDELNIDAGNSGTTEYLALPMLSSLGIQVNIDEPRGRDRKHRGLSSRLHPWSLGRRRVHYRV